MATVADSGLPTLQNIMKIMQPNGGVETQLANTLTKLLPLLDDIPFQEGNLPTGDRVTSVLALPSVASAWRKLNQGVPATKGETEQYDETCGMLEAFPKVDVRLANLNGNAAAYRMAQNKMHYEALTEEAERALFYASTITNPEQIHGFFSRYAATSGYQASDYVQKIGTPATSGGCYSILVVTWDQDRIFGIYPKGSKAGLSHEDLGPGVAYDASNNEFMAYRSHFTWEPGLEVKDYRYAARAQWDPSDGGNTDSAKTLYLGLGNLLDTVREVNGNTRIYMNRATRKKLRAQLLSNSQLPLQTIELNGFRMQAFDGVPIRITDTIVGEDPIS